MFTCLRSTIPPRSHFPVTRGEPRCPKDHFMIRASSLRWLSACIVAVFLTALSMSLKAEEQAQFTLVRLSKATFKNGNSEHKKEVEPHTFAWGSTMVSAFQVARVFGGGGADVGFATSTDGGQTWTSGYHPGLAVNHQHGTFSVDRDPAVAGAAA